MSNTLKKTQVSCHTRKFTIKSQVSTLSLDILNFNLYVIYIYYNDDDSVTYKSKL